MGIQITGKNVEVGESYQTYVTDKIEFVVGKYVGEGLAGHVRLEKERGLFRTDCSIQLRSGLTLQSHGEAADAYASADAAFEHLEKRIRRYKRRLTNHHRAGQSARKTNGVNAPDYVVTGGNDDETLADSAAPVIVAETQRLIRELPVSEAVMELDVSQQSVVVFRNAGHGGLNIIYRRADGNIGWIDPKSGD